MTDVQIRQGQEGSRWINQRPTGEEVAAWFKDNVKVHDGMSHEDYVAGITLIPNKEKADQVVGFNQETGNAIIREKVESLVFTPYPRVDIRVLYWQDWMAKNPEWLGVLERVPPPEPSVRFPEGFFSMTVQEPNNKVTQFVCCSVRARVYKRETVKWEKLTVNKRTGEQRMVMTGEVVLDAPPATKMIPLLGRYGADPSSLMKAETGAVGRALGLAGVLVVPGAGVATAEDMQEVAQMVTGEGEVAAPVSTAGPALPSDEQPAVEDADQLRTRVNELMDALKEAAPQRHKAMQKWARDRKLNIHEADVPALRGAVRKLEREVDAAASEATPEGGDGGEG